MLFRTCCAGLLACAAFSVSSTLSAQAAPAQNWTGFYAGVGGGFGGFLTDEKDVDPSASPALQASIDSSTNGEGGFLALMAGYDQALADHWLVGAYGEFDLDSAAFHVNNDFIDVKVRQKHEWAVGGRVGYAATADFLLFASAGYTNTRIDQEAVPAPPPFIQLLPYEAGGWFAGAGTEANLGDSLSVRFEYRYASYPEKVTFRNTSNDIFSTSKPVSQTARIVFAYRLGMDGAQSATDSEQPAPKVDLSGLYVGAGGGYGFSFGKLFSFVPGIITQNADASIGARGGFGTLLAGYDYRLAPDYVLGVFGDVDLGDISFKQSPASFPEGWSRISENMAWAFGLRSGYGIGASSMLFIDGGYTGAHFSANITPGVPGEDAHFGTFNGWFLGVGGETALCEDLALRLEYRYASYGRQRVFSAPGPFGGTAYDDFTPHTHTARIALVYRP